MGNPIALGTLLAVMAALAFGLTTPFIQRLGEGLGPFATAGLLYLGAALGTLPLPWRTSSEPPLCRAHLARLAAVALLGAAVAPSLFVWGLQRIPATTASLLLNAEAVFTVALAALVLHEHVGRRVARAVALIAAGGVVAVAGSGEVAAGGLLGAGAVVAAVLCWALDNILSRKLADLDPAAVVRGKALIGLALTFGLALLRAEPLPRLGVALGLVVCGATGYGLSLRLYLLAQRRIGSGRTGSIFALAPFLGAAAAAVMGDRGLGWATLAAGVLFTLGVALHLTEKHRHQHVHSELEHDHAHRHDDGHHDHHHDEHPEGAHSHPHRHAETSHSREHGPDLHHEHRH